ncbi:MULTISPECIES: MFS transporter [unclassified Moorena]|uniref:MFS transporter n=1 Tax=unclassified Moorena TaxID=2683338 RepID=UPI0013F887C6|nr:MULTISPECIES: MFS transporter [unclassified Moorena]NEO12363.1 MFS transporter [Moorena sp. SIO3E8]NEP21565.1 MFS transporter [Moorena sp. SIO3I6]NEP99347.1 MFS transporter [Moorena sp. SIO3F7]
MAVQEPSQVSGDHQISHSNALNIDSYPGTSSQTILEHNDPKSRLKISLLLLGFLLIGLYESSISVLILNLQIYYQVDKATVAFLLLGGTLGHFIAALTIGFIENWLGRLSLLLIGINSFVIATLACSLCPPFKIFILLPILIGFGLAIIETWFNAYLVMQPNSKIWLNYLHALWGVGALLGPIIAASIIASNQGWYNIYRLWALLGFLLAIALYLAFSDQADTTLNYDDSQGSQPSVLQAALTSPIIWFTSGFVIFCVGTEHSLGDWAYSFLCSIQHESHFMASLSISTYWLGMTLARLGISILFRWFEINQLLYLCMFSILINMMLIWFWPSVIMSTVGLGIAGLSLGPLYPTILAVVAKQIQPRLVISAIAIISGLGKLGTSIVPWLMGLIAQKFSLWSLFPYIMLLAMIMVILWTAMNFLYYRPEQISING